MYLLWPREQPGTLKTGEDLLPIPQISSKTIQPKQVPEPLSQPSSLGLPRTVSRTDRPFFRDPSSPREEHVNRDREGEVAQTAERRRRALLADGEDRGPPVLRGRSWRRGRARRK